MTEVEQLRHTPMASVGEAMTEVEQLRQALTAVLIGVNHIATYHTDKWPDPGSDHETALEKLGAGMEYDMWCCWNAAMRNRDLVE